MPACVRGQLPEGCTGPYWIVGRGVRPNVRRDSALFSVEVNDLPEGSFFFLRKKAVLDGWAESGASLSGELVLYDRCPRVMDGAEQYVLLWPPEYAVRVEDGMVAFLDGSGEVVAAVGDQVRLGGGAIPKVWDSDQYRQLYYELPGDCFGPYWVVGE